MSRASPIRSRAVRRPPTSARGGLPIWPARSCCWPITGKGMLTYSPFDRRRLGQGLGGIWRPPMCNAPSAAGSFKDGQMGELEERPGPQRRRLADAPPVARLRRGQVEPARPMRRRSTPASCRKNPTGARSSAPCGWPGGCSPPPRCNRFVREESLPGMAGADRRRWDRTTRCVSQHLLSRQPYQHCPQWVGLLGLWAEDCRDILPAVQHSHNGELAGRRDRRRSGTRTPAKI